MIVITGEDIIISGGAKLLNLEPGEAAVIVWISGLIVVRYYCCT